MKTGILKKEGAPAIAKGAFVTIDTIVTGVNFPSHETQLE